ncbi:MAG: DUF1566 domain-containing protein [Proteobacteria bacterium]|nr:DUF1566 domain-containing protein [Pseudomonadota bacterium]
MLHLSTRRPFASLLRLLPTAALVLLAPTISHAFKLNDTGLDICYSASNAPVPCADPTAIVGQDAMWGRDAAGMAPFSAQLFFKIGAGGAGFDYTQICANGDAAGSGTCPLNPPANTGPNPAPTQWACTRDNVTGLLWSLESKTGGTWVTYSASATTSRCGYTSGWRMPTTRELLSIVNSGTHAPAIDSFFPGTQLNWYWAAELEAINPANAWMVDFTNGAAGTNTKTDLSFPTRLVHGPH